MSTLEDDIARIARLRGRDPAELIQKARSGPTYPIPVQLLSMIFMSDGDVRHELDAHDRLPAKSRRFITEAPRFISSRIWRDALAAVGGNEDVLIDLVKAKLETRQ